MCRFSVVLTLDLALSAILVEVSAPGLLPFSAVSPVAAAPSGDAKVTFLDLQPYTNQKLKDNLHGGIEGNNLTELPTGKQTLERIPFMIQQGFIQLGSKALENKPIDVQGIKIGKRFAKMYFLHGTGYGGGPNEPGNLLHVPDDTTIGRYKLHYEDKSTQEVPIVYGQDVRDWWYVAKEKDIARGLIGWTGDNDAAKANNARIRLYITTWENPKPGKKVLTMDYLSTKETAAAPFCIAVTLEGK